jgi:hypothetical protein
MFYLTTRPMKGQTSSNKKENMAQVDENGLESTSIGGRLGRQ